MKKLVCGRRVGLSHVALWAALSVVAVGCASGTSQSGGSGGSNGGATGSGTGGAGVTASGTGGAVTTSGTGGLATTSGTGGTATTSGSGGAVTTSGTGGTATTSGSGGAVTTSGSGGMTTTGASTVELIGPGPATCGATNGTHGDGFICVLNYPKTGPNAVGYWFDYAFTAGTCNVAFTKPSGNNATNPKVCFSGSACPTSSGGGLGLAVCDVHGVDVSTWPELMMLESASSLSSTAKSAVSGCNPGAAIASVSWTLGSGSLPAGMSVLFDDASDTTVTRVDNVAAGATSVAVPANVDTSKVASIKFSVSGSSSASWNFCLTSLKVTLR